MNRPSGGAYFTPESVSGEVEHPQFLKRIKTFNITDDIRVQVENIKLPKVFKIRYLSRGGG